MLWKERGISIQEVEDWQVKIAERVMNPVIQSLVGSGVHGKIIRPAGSTVSNIYGLIADYALMQLNHGNRQYYSQSILRQQVHDHEKALKDAHGGGHAIETLLGKVFKEIENRMAVFRGEEAAAPVIEKIMQKANIKDPESLIVSLEGLATAYAEELTGICHSRTQKALNKFCERELLKSVGVSDVNAVKQAVEKAFPLRDSAKAR